MGTTLMNNVLCSFVVFVPETQWVAIDGYRIKVSLARKLRRDKQSGCDL